MKNLSFYRKTNYPKLFAIALLCMSVSVVSCDKEEDEVVPTPTPTTPTAPGNPTVDFADGNGTLTAVNSRTFQNIPGLGSVAIDLGIAVAVFYDDPTTGTFLEAGTVMCEGEDLKKQANNSYVYTPGPLNQEGIDFSNGDVTWNIEGMGTVPQFDYTTYIDFPNVEKMTSEKTVDKTADYTLESAGISNADSVIFILGGIYHIVAGFNSSHTFTKAELATLEAGANFAQITAYRWDANVAGGKTYYFVNETVVTEPITIK